MAQGPDRKYMTRTEAEVAGVDVGLRNYMLRVYNYMALGVGLTGALALFVVSQPALMQAIGGMFWIFFIGVLGLGFFAPRIMMSKSVVAAQACFWVYATLWGLLIAPIFAQFIQAGAGMDIVRAFFITAGTFAAVSIYGYTTKRDLSPFATFFFMAAIGVLIAILVNVFFVQSTLFSLITSVIVVLLFSGITAYETQVIKSMYQEGDMDDTAQRKAIFGAFMLYGSFITLFIHILNILGIMRE